MLSSSQKKVRQGMLIGAVIAVAVLACGMHWSLFDNEQVSLHDHLKVFALAALLPIFVVVVSIARIASYRFFHEEAIDPTQGHRPAQQLTILHALLQNSLEQAFLAIILYLLWVILMPTAYLAVPLFNALLFLFARFLFFTQYHKGAGARALGFAASFYPNVFMLLCLLIYGLTTW